MTITAQLADGRQLEFPDGTDPSVIQRTVKNMITASAPEGPKPTVSQQLEELRARKATDQGRAMNSSVQGAITALQGPTFGFLDELAGVGSAVVGGAANLVGLGDGKTIAENYREGRDKVRGATDRFREDYPVTATGTSILASAPTIAAAPVRGVQAVQAAPKVMGAGSRILQAAQSGLGYGAVGGVGESKSDNALDIANDAGWSAALGAVTGGAVTGGASGVGAVAGNVAQRFRQSSAVQAAREKIAEALLRDARGEAFIAGRSNPLNQAATRLDKLGQEATLTDAGGRSVNTLLDTMATLPGRTKNLVENVIHARQAGRAGRLTEAADAALGTQGAGFTSTLERFDSMKKAAKPFYDQLKGVSVRVDDDLSGMIQAAESAHGNAEILAKLRREVPIDLSKIKAGDDVPFNALDTVKQSLWDRADAAKRAGENKLGQAYDDLRIALTNKLDDLSPKTKAGESIYAKARNTFAGPAQMEQAVEAGRTAMKTDAIGVAELMRGMSASEQEAFRIGALQSIKDKVGTEAGQTSLLKMWKEPATSGRLKEIFGNDYREFAKAVAAEARLKPLEQVGRGSRTAERLYGAGDLDMQAAGDAVNVIAGAATQRPGQIASGALGLKNAWNRVQTPEAVRDEIGRILLMRGPAGQRELAQMSEAVRKVSEARARRAAQAGAFSGLYVVE